VDLFLKRVQALDGDVADILLEFPVELGPGCRQRLREQLGRELRPGFLVEVPRRSDGWQSAHALQAPKSVPACSEGRARQCHCREDSGPTVTDVLSDGAKVGTSSVGLPHVR